MRLIDADALLKSCRIVPVHDGENWSYTPIVTDGDILNAPTITLEDLRPKGRWESNYPFAPRCSNCKRPGKKDSDGYNLPICLYCLADMTGGEDDD